MDKINQDAALEILKEIHKGTRTFNLIDEQCGNMPDFISTLDNMYQTGDSEKFVLDCTRENEEKVFSINGRWHPFWSNEIRDWLRDHGYLKIPVNS